MAARGAGALLTASLLLAVPGALATRSADPRGQAAAATAVLSNLTTLSRWAYPQAPADAHVAPSTRAAVIDHLHFLTSDGQAQIYIALRSYSVGADKWTLVDLPGRPNGRVGWVPDEALGEMHSTDEYLRINRQTLRATLYRAGRKIWAAPAGVGRPSLPTPRGQFYVTEKLAGMGNPFYGPYAIGTSAYAPSLSEWPGGGVVGIHGTNEPELIPGRPSHGCVRLRNADLVRLWPLIGVGTPIEIV
jgi:hypothetical protein